MAFPCSLLSLHTRIVEPPRVPSELRRGAQRANFDIQRTPSVLSPFARRVSNLFQACSARPVSWHPAQEHARTPEWTLRTGAHLHTDCPTARAHLPGSHQVQPTSSAAS